MRVYEMKLKQNENFPAQNSAISKAMKILKLINHQNGINVKSVLLVKCWQKKMLINFFSNWNAKKGMESYIDKESPMSSF